MVRVDVDPVSELEARCPMCRTMTSASEDVRRAEELKARYPKMWAERELEAQEDEALQGETDAIQTITVYIGNRHELARPDVEAEVEG